MRIVWWLPVSDWVTWANLLLDYGFYAHVHYDQNLLLADPSTKKFVSGSINCDLLIIDRELFPIPDGYVEYDSATDRWKIYYWTAFQDLMSILKSKGVVLANTGGMFSWYCCTRKGLIPSDVSQVDVEFPWGWEAASKIGAWGDAEWSQDIWNIGNKGQRTLYYYIKGVDPGAEIQAFTDGLQLPLPFTGLVYYVDRAVKAWDVSPNVTEIGMTPLSIGDWDTYKVAVTAINFNCPVMIYGIRFASQYDAINVIIDLMTGITSVQNYSVLYKPPVRILNPQDEVINFAYAWAGPTHLKFLFKVKNLGKSRVVLSIAKLLEHDLFVRLDKKLLRYVKSMDLVEESERKTLASWAQVDPNTWQSVFSAPEDFTCDFDAGVVRLLFIKLNVLDVTGNITIRLRAYTTDTDYFEETRNLWNWHCYKPGVFWLVWAICVVPQSRFGTVVGSPNADSISKVEIYISDTSKVTLDTAQPPLKVTYQRIPPERWCVIDRGSYLLLTFWDSDGNFTLEPGQERNFIMVINPTPLLSEIKAVYEIMPWDPKVKQIYDDALDASFYFELEKLYRELLDYLDAKGTDLSKKVRDLITIKL